MDPREGLTPLSQLPLRLHQYAFVVRDQEANRRFFEAPNNLDRAHAPART